MCVLLHSSDDDLDVILHGTLQQRKRLNKKRLIGDESSSEDEFEKEMKAELNVTMKKIEANHTAGCTCELYENFSCVLLDHCLSVPVVLKFCYRR